jgi:hypothetical protein
VELARALALVSVRVVELVSALVSVQSLAFELVPELVLPLDLLLIVYYRPLKNITSSTYSFL